MILYYLLCSIFIPPIVYSTNVVVPTQDVNSKSIINATSIIKEDFSLQSEGGKVLASASDLSLPKYKQSTSLLELDRELVNHKDTTSIKARKGVDDIADNSTILIGTTELKNSTVTSSTVNSKNESHEPVSKNTNGNNKNTTSTNPKPLATTKVPKKPQILSYESLINADKNIHELKILPANPSLKPLPSSEKNQIPSPNEEHAVVKLYPSKANSHPGMIMPIVITILVVPMFAVVGYMALRRGQEAWKNRHYKRMDFLLDGMYND